MNEFRTFGETPPVSFWPYSCCCKCMNQQIEFEFRSQISFLHYLPITLPLLSTNNKQNNKLETYAIIKPPWKKEKDNNNKNVQTESNVQSKQWSNPRQLCSFTTHLCLSHIHLHGQ